MSVVLLFSMFIKFIVTAIGATAGAWICWGAGQLLNPLTPLVPLGTLVVNLLGGFLMRVSLQLFFLCPLSAKSSDC
jgi:CrcB protein